MATIDKEGKPSAFQRLADTVSYAMGTPANIIFWLLAVAIWIALGPFIAGHAYLPAWFTSQAFNFPLNTVTTIAELYIGFLVGASTNRSERDVKSTLRSIANQAKQIKDVEEKLAHALEVNTELTREVQRLTRVIHEKVSAA
jgi:low affinity Fe/Cu permease